MSRMKEFIPLIVFVILLGIVLIAIAHQQKIQDEQRKIEHYEEFQQDIKKQYEDTIKYLDIDSFDVRKGRSPGKDIFTKIVYPGDNFRDEIKEFGRDKVDAALSEYRSNALALDNYVNALQILEKQEYKEKYPNSLARYKAAYDAIDKVPPKYYGPLKDRITEDRQNIASMLEEVQAEVKVEQEERNKKVYMGDPESKIRQVYGTPIKVNRTVTRGVERKQYVYSNLYIYTENGRVIGWQD